ncbi:hypothetical protein IOD16_27335 [Saccharothrix sp. 6-C]|uniref:hypothetical protein n=1 Tax=Saccharothrix sp. 6-C TaxID=2781735 RepID=UPI0019172A77|nr:hypothetical protein [Saccharothrix sp. 6-C]QQQ74824.1 hypothetical protein IOD16_27335 [Saccharothrix sp. 6-C]
MAGENPLVEAPPAESGSFFTAGTGDNGWATGISIAESAMDTFNGIKDGNWVEAGLGMVGLAADAAAMAIDPFGTLLSSAAAFLMEHMQPLKEMLDWLAGNPPVIESYSTTWNNVAEELGKIAEEYGAGVRRGTEGWTGSAAETYRTNSEVHGDALTGAASAAGTVGTVVGLMGMVVGFVREMVRDLIADLVGKLIAWVLEAVFSLGFGTPVIVAQAVTAISKWAAKIAKIVQDLLNTIKKVSPMLKRLVEVFEKIMKVVGKLAGKVTGLDVLDPGNIKKGGFLQTGRADIDAPSGSPDTSPSGTGTSGTGTSGNGTSSTSDSAPPSNRPGDTTSTSGSTTADAPPTSRPGRGDPADLPPSSPRPGRDPGGPEHDLPRGATPGPGSPAPGNTTPGNTTPGNTAPRGTSPVGEHRGGPGGNAPIGEHRGGPGGQPAPGSYSGGGGPSPNGGGSPSGGSPVGGGGPSGGGSPGGGSPNPTTPPHRFDQTSAATAAATEAPARPDQPHSGGPSTGNPNTTAPQSNQPGPGSAGGAPPAGSPGGGSPGGAPGGGARPGSGGGWTGTPGSRGDAHSGIPAARGPENLSPSSRGPSGTNPSHTGPTHAGPTHAGPTHAGPTHTNPAQAGPPHQGPPHQSPPHQGPPRTGPANPSAPHSPSGPAHTNPPHTTPSQHNPNNGPPNRGPAGAPHQRDGSPDFARPRGGDGPAPHAPKRPDGPPLQRHPDSSTPAPRRDPDAQPPRRDQDGIPSQRRDPDAWTPPHRDPDPHADSPTPDSAKPDGAKPDGDGPHGDGPDPTRPDGDQPSIDEAHARHGETTPAGISHHRGDGDMGDLPHRVPPDPRYFTADVHVTPDGRARIGNHTYTPEQYGDLLRRNGWDGKTPIRLIGCDAGRNDFADRLSRHTGADVLAPTKPAWTDTNGRVYTSDAEIGPDGNRRPRVPPNGEWNTHRPDGTTARTGDDGYAPGTDDADKADHTGPDDARVRGAPDEEHKPPTATTPRDPTEFPPAEPPSPTPDAPESGHLPDRSRGAVLERIDVTDTTRVTTRDGRIETVDGKPVKQYVGELAESRAANHGGRAGRANGPYVAVAVDLRTGLVTEGVNGKTTDLIAPKNLHPLLRENYRDMDVWEHPIMDGPDQVKQAPVKNPDGPGHLKDENGDDLLQDWVLQGQVHPDQPLRHAEVKAVNELLWARQQQHERDWFEQHGPGSTPPPLPREALQDMRFDPRNLQEQLRKDADGVKVKTGDIGDPGPACGNCSVILRDVGSYSGRLQYAPFDYRSKANLIPPVAE